MGLAIGMPRPAASAEEPRVHSVPQDAPAAQIGVCRTCAFYDDATCHRSPPTLTGFPGVRPTDWCGEYVPGGRTLWTK